MLPIINHFPPRAFSDLETLFSACRVEQGEPAKRGDHGCRRGGSRSMGLCGRIQSVSSKSFHARVPARHPLYVAPPELRDEPRRLFCISFQ